MFGLYLKGANVRGPDAGVLLRLSSDDEEEAERYEAFFPAGGQEINLSSIVSVLVRCTAKTVVVDQVSYVAQYTHVFCRVCSVLYPERV